MKAFEDVAYYIWSELNSIKNKDLTNEEKHELIRKRLVILGKSEYQRGIKRAINAIRNDCDKQNKELLEPYVD